MTSKVKDLLKFTYREVESLESFVSHLGAVHVRQDGDKAKYLQLLETCIVCTSYSYTSGKKSVKSYSQTCRQGEIISIAIKRLLKSKGKNQNLLTYGFTEPTNNAEHVVAVGFGIERQHSQHGRPNGCVQLLSTSPWKLLLSRIGDELMLHMLETRSIFIALPGSNYLQVTGLPIYKEVSRENGESCLYKGKPSNAVTVKRNRPAPAIKDGRVAETRKRKRKDCEDQSPKRRCLNTETLNMDIEEALEFLEDDSSENRSLELLSGPSDARDTDETAENHPWVKRSKSTRRRDRRKKQRPDNPEVKDQQSGKCLFIYHTPILKRSVLYAKDLREKLSKKYLLTGSEPSPEGVQALAEKVLKEASASLRNAKSKTVMEELDVLRDLRPVLLDFINSHRCCKYAYILDSKCPLKQSAKSSLLPKKGNQKTTQSSQQATVSKEMKAIPSTDNNKRGKQDARVAKTANKAIPVTDDGSRKKEAIAQMISSTYTHTQVYLFLRRIILKVVPSAMFGCKKNQKLFLKVVANYVSLGKFQKIYLGELLDGVKLTSVSWLRKFRNLRIKEFCYLAVVRTLMVDFVIPLITSYFYVTDNAAYRNLLFYYRKSTWRKIHKLGLQELLERKMLCSLAQEAVDEEVKKSLGLCILRFLPKLSGVRPILNMAARKVNKRSINMNLSDALQALSYLAKKQGNCMESSIHGVEDIYRKWYNYVEKCRGKSVLKLYFVKVDIQHCYDTIDQKKMMGIVRDIFPKTDEADFLVRRYATVSACAGRWKTMYKQDVTTLDDDVEPRFKGFISKVIEDTGMHSSIVVDQVYTQFEKSNYFLQKIESHLMHNVVKVGQDVHLQCTGISQGCVLSSLLCSLYYSQMEQKYLKIGTNDLLMRQVDDFLYVTPDICAARTFLTTMLGGIPEYNCETHPSKTVTNFPVKGCSVQVLPQNATLFPWCGLLFDMKTLEVQMQTARYAGMSMRDTMTFNAGLCPGKSLRVKLQQSLRPKFTALLLDPEVNGWECQVHNTWKAFLLTAFRCHSCLRSMQSNRMNVHYLIDTVGELASFLHRQVGRHVIGDASKILTKKEMAWLCIDAFALKMKQHHGRYFNLLKKIRRKKKQLEKQLGKQVVGKLTSTVGSRLPEEFLLIFD